MKRTLIVILCVLSEPVLACLCDEKLALEKAVAIIVEKDPDRNPEVSNYDLTANGNKYYVIPKGVDTEMRGGGYPIAIVHRERCTVLGVEYAQ